MICLDCDSEEFVFTPDAAIEQEFRGEKIIVKSPAMACSMCGRIELAVSQADELRKKTADSYRKKHGLLTSDMMRALRELVGMNQLEFARLIGVGEASVKRWETWMVQSKGNDDLIRMKIAKALETKEAR